MNSKKGKVDKSSFYFFERYVEGLGCFEALALTRSLAVADSITIVAGSFYLVGEILYSLSAFLTL